MIRVENEEEFLQNEGKKLRVVLELTLGIMCGGHEPPGILCRRKSPGLLICTPVSSASV